MGNLTVRGPGKSGLSVRGTTAEVAIITSTAAALAFGALSIFGGGGVGAIIAGRAASGTTGRSATVSAPGLPSLTVIPVDTAATLLTSAFAGGPGDTHASSDWQIDTVTANFSSPVWSSSDSLLSWTRAGASIPLDSGGVYKARVRHVADYGRRVGMERRGHVHGLVCGGRMVLDELRGRGGFDATAERAGVVTWSPYQGNPKGTLVKDELARTGSKALKFWADTIQPLYPGDWQFNNQIDADFLTTDYHEFWLDFWLYYPDGTEGITDLASWRHVTDGTGSQNDKFFRFWGSGDVHGSVGTVGASTNPVGNNDSYFFIEYNKVAGSQNWGLGQVTYPTDEHRGQWSRVQIHGKKDLGGNDGTIDICLADSIQVPGLIGTMSTPSITDDHYRNLYLGGAANGGNSSGLLTAYYLDDLTLYYVDPGWASPIC